MVPPELAIDRGEVQMVRSRIAPSEELSPGNSLLSTMHVTGGGEYLDAFRYGRAFSVTAENIENRLGRQTGNCGASRVLQS